MVEIRYGENYEIADIAGKTVADARAQYKAELGIPDKAQARLNGKGLSRRHEPGMELGKNDRLFFAEQSHKGLIFLTSILLALAVTAGVFAFTATTTTVTLSLTNKNEFASVSAAGAPPTWNVWGFYKGKMTAGNLFSVTPEAAYTGDLSVAVVLTNSYDLVKAYRVLVFKLTIYEDDGTGTAPDTTKPIGTSQYLTMTNGEVIFDLTSLAGKVSPYWVRLDNGFYQSHHSWTAGEEDPILLADVAQKGVM